MLAAVFLAAGWLAPGTPPAAAEGTITTNIRSCALLRSVGISTVDGVTTPSAGYETEHCFAKSNLGSRFGSLIVRKFVSSEGADAAGIQPLAALSAWKQAQGYGERTIACVADDCLWPGQTGGLVFHRGCYTVQGAWDAASDRTIHGKLSQLDSKLKGEPCGEASAAPSLPTAGTLGVSVNCEHEFADPGLVKCAAQPVHAAADAAISYAWTFDGAPQRGMTAAELQMTEVKPGAHTVTVVANDTTNNLTSEQETISFTKGTPSAGTPNPAGGGPPPLGSWKSTPSSGGSNPASGGSNPSGGSGGSNGGPGIDPATLVGGTAGIGLLIGGVVIAGRLRGRRKPPTTSPEGARGTPPPPRGPARTPPASGPEVPAARTSKQQPTEALVLIADPATVIVHGDDKEAISVRIRALKSTGGVSVDVSADVSIVVQPAPDDKHILVTPIDKMTFTVKGAHVGTQPHDCRIMVSGSSLRTGQPATPVQIQVRVTPVKVDVRIEAIKKGFVYQEFVATVPDICRTVSGTIVGIDPTPQMNLEDPSGPEKNLEDPSGPETTTNREPVAQAHYWASYRLDGGPWSSQLHLTTEEGGGLRFGLLRDLAARLDAENVEYRLPNPIELSVNAEVTQSVTSYGQELQSFSEKTTDAADAQWQSSLVLAGKECARYPHEFFKQLCKNREDDYQRLLGAINLLRGSLIFSYKFRHDFRWQRNELNRTADEIYGGIFAVLLALPISTSVVNAFRPANVKGAIVAVAKWCRGRGLLGRLAFNFVMASVWITRAGLQRLVKLVGWMLETATELAATFKLSPRYFQGLAQDLYRSAAMPDLEALVRDFSIGHTDELERMVGAVFAQVVGVLALFCDVIECFFYGVAHIVLVVVTVGIRAACFFFGTLMRSLGYKGTVEMWGEALDSAADGGIMPKGLGALATLIFDKAAAFLHFNRLAKDRAAGKTLCDTVLDSIWSYADMDQRIGDRLTDAYNTSLALQIQDDWLDAMHAVSKNESIRMGEWNKSYSQDAQGSWGWIKIGETCSFVLQVIAKVVQAIMFCWAALTELGAKLAVVGAEKLFENFWPGARGPRYLRHLTEGPLKVTSRLDLLTDLADLLFRAGMFGIMVFRLHTVYALVPKTIDDLYGRGSGEQ